MRVLVLGATGSIGTAVAAELHANNHTVIALARSNISKETLQNLGYVTLMGNIRKPAEWSAVVDHVDAIVQVATTFTDDMGDVDRLLLKELGLKAKRNSRNLRFIYTGGCWLYGETGDKVADETTPFQPIPSFAWMVENAEYLLAAEAFNSAIIHPAMVYHQKGGVFTRFIEQATTHHSIEIWGSRDVRWPLVHRDDLAVSYRLLLENQNLTGHFNASTQEGVRVSEITAEIAKQFGSSSQTVGRKMESVIAEYGSWAEGPSLDQQMTAQKLRTTTGWQPVFTDFAKTEFA